MTQMGNVRDKSIASLSGSSQTAVAQNGARQFLEICNSGNADIAFNCLGATAAIGAGNITIAAKGRVVYDHWVPQGQVNVIGTAGQPVTIFEA